MILLILTAASQANDSIPAPDVFYLHPKRSVKSIDSLVAPSAADSLRGGMVISSDDDYGNLFISGYKSFGVSVGELGEINLEQGLEAVIEGEVRPGTMLRAQLSDQGSSLDGSTREISEFDMMFISLTNKNFAVTAGDMFTVWPAGGILSGQKKVVGISAAVTPGPAAVHAFGSFSGGNSTVQTVRGREGVQGPYYLTGRGEASIITPVDGTVKVRVNGDNLSEGADADFVIDYDIGAVTFNPRVLISGDDFIRIEYEYKAFDYRRTFAGGGASYHTRDSVFSIHGILWSESDDKDHPIEMQLGSREREILRNSGNNPAYAASTARPVHPLDVARMSVFHPLYKKVFDTFTQDTILVHTPYDPLRPEDTRGFYTAHFTPIQTGSAGADYVVDNTAQHSRFVYKYAGPGLGDHTALAPITAPMRETAGEIEARLRLPFVNASLNIAGKESNRNLFSTLDGNDLSSAVIFKLSAGERRFDRRSIWADADYRYRSQKFTNEIFSASERNEAWGADDIADGAGEHQFQAWKSTVGGTVARGAAVSAGVGQTFIDSLAETEKINADIQLRFLGDRAAADAGAVFFRHHLSDINTSQRKYATFTARPSQFWETTLGYRDEWRVDTAGQGGGHLAGTVEAAYLPANLRQSFSAMRYQSGESFLGSIDTGYALTWNQSAAFSPLKIWRLTGDSRWRYVKINEQSSASTFLMSAISDIEPTASGFSSRQEYRVNRELASRFEQKKFFVGRGLGTHAFDSTAGEFRPAVHGDHIIQEVQIYDNTSSATVRKTMLGGDWYFRPTREISGILGDLAWSGVLSLEEHIDSRDGRMISYIPGILSFFPRDVEIDSDASETPNGGYPNYSDLSYRQDIDYQIQGSPWRSRLYLMPGLRIIRGYREPTFETGLLIERRKNSILLSTEPRYFSVTKEFISTSRNSPQNNFAVSDASVELVQSVGHNQKFELYIRERIGRIFDGSSARIHPVPADSGVYLQIRPGIIHRPVRGGIAELSYTFSHVPYSGEIDHRMAGGHSGGTSHIITFHSNINAGKYFNFSGMYRGEAARRIGDDAYAPMTHVFSLQVKAFL
ncbi:MAG: hypothetical protein LBC70_00870 [Chitinispirillales bacterium]|nr:hypothetical protein [Chitinispirillales bacterium]